MKIKSIRASKEKKGFKKQIISFAFLGLSLILTSCKSTSELQTKYDHLQEQYEDLQDQYEDLQRQYDDLAENFKIDRVEDRYYKNDLMAVVTNDKEGTPEYHFVKENIVDIDLGAGTNLSFKENVYVSITNDQLAYPNKCYRQDLVNGLSYKYDEIKESVRVNSCPFNGWIPDYNLQYYLVHDINNLPIPKEYKEKSYYSLEELKAIEEAMNNNSLDVIEQVNQKIEQNTFQKEGLYFAYCEDLNDGFLIDSKKYLEIIEASDPYDIYTFEYQNYYYSITDPTRGLKIDTNDPVFESEDKIADQKEFISLNENDLFVGKTCAIANIEDYKESYSADELTYEEIVELENRIRTSLKEQNVLIKTKR